MAEEKEKKSRTAELWLRICTTEGVVYEKYVDFLKIKRKDGVMIINKNYSSVLEQLVDGKITVQEKSKKVLIDAMDSWLTISNNRCNIYSSKAEIVSN